MPRLRHASILVAAIAFAAGAARAQAALSTDSTTDNAATSESSSSAGLLAVDAEPGALPAAPSAQDDRGGRGYHSHSVWSHLTYEAGGGFNAPTSDPRLTLRGAATLRWARATGSIHTSACWPSISSSTASCRAPLSHRTGSDGGHAHIWSLTLAPVVDLMPKHTNDFYVTGGGGFYRKVTSFTDIEPTEYMRLFLLRHWL